MLRARFHANPDDPRPVKWPIKYPFWVSGRGDGYSIVVAYVDDITELMELWPEATHITHEERDAILFTSRFGQPDWYDTASNPTVTHAFLS